MIHKKESYGYIIGENLHQRSNKIGFKKGVYRNKLKAVNFGLEYLEDNVEILHRAKFRKMPPSFMNELMKEKTDHF